MKLLKNLLDEERERSENDLAENYLKSNLKRSDANGPNDPLRGVFVRLGKRQFPTSAQRISSRSKAPAPAPIERYISWNYLRQHLMKRNQAYHTLSSVRL